MTLAVVAVRTHIVDLLRPLLDTLDARIVSVAPGQALPKDATVLLQTAMDPMPAQAILAAPDSLRLIANLGVGHDNIDLVAAANRGIAVSNTPVVTEDTADLTLALLLAAARKLNVFEGMLRAGEWQASQAQLGTRIHGKTLGIVGFGAIGQAVARRALGFGMSVVYHGPRRKHGAEQSIAARYCQSLTDMLSQSDFVSLNCPLDEHSRHLINRDTLGSFKIGAILINTGRGGLIDEAALVEALRSGILGGAGLDVFEFEPQIHAGLLELESVTLLPHIGTATRECRMDIALRGIANVAAFLASGAPIDRVKTAKLA